MEMRWCYYEWVELMESKKMITNAIVKVICDGVDVTDDLMPDCVIDSKEKIVRVAYSEKYDRAHGDVNFSSALICVELKPKRVVIHYANGEGDICNWSDNPGVNWGRDVSDIDNGSIEKVTEGLKVEFSEIIPKPKLVRPQMTAKARDILKSWDGESYSEKIKIMNMTHSVMSNSLRVSSRNVETVLSERDDCELTIKEKAKELSTIAGYLAISICVNFVAIGWVAWTKGWLS